MRILYTSRLLVPLALALSSFEGISQQVALLDAPEPTLNASSSSLSGSSLGSSFASSSSPASASAIMPVRRPAPEQKPGFAPTDWTLLGAGAMLRFLDYKSTVKCMSDPANFREVELPQALVHNRPALGAFETGTVVVNYYAYRFLIERRHRKLARLGQAINIGVMAFTVGRNYYELNEFWPKENLFHEDYAAKQ